eukprot:8175-Heterococcus_DN1.PRE.5
MDHHQKGKGCLTSKKKTYQVTRCVPAETRRSGTHKHYWAEAARKGCRVVALADARALSTKL